MEKCILFNQIKLIAFKPEKEHKEESRNLGNNGNNFIEDRWDAWEIKLRERINKWNNALEWEILASKWETTSIQITYKKFSAENNLNCEQSNIE